jgi:hypothetical protein
LSGQRWEQVFDNQLSEESAALVSRLRSIPVEGGYVVPVGAVAARLHALESTSAAAPPRPPYTRSSVPMEGRLDFKFEHRDDRIFPVGFTQTKTGLTALHSLHSTLEALSGKRVRVTVEWDDAEGGGS